MKAIELGYDYAKAALPLPAAAARRAHGQDRGPHHDRRQHGRRPRLPSTPARPSAPWYPITPSTSLMDAFKSVLREAARRSRDRQGATTPSCRPRTSSPAIGMVLGANWNGARAFTPTSGPGISLMNEFLGFAYYAEMPAVIFDVQRVGPSTGMPTRTQQCDLCSAPTPRTATRSTCCCSRRTRKSASTWRVAGLRPRRAAADAGVRACPTSTSA